MKFRVLLLALSLLLLVTVLAGCDKQQTTTTTTTAASPTTTATDPGLYQVTFSGAGVTMPVQLVNRGELVSRPADPEREGYDFAGWMRGPVEDDFSAPVTSHMTLVAQWVEKTCDMVFLDTDGTELLSVSVPYGTEVTVPSPDLSCLADNELMEHWINGEGDVFSGIAKEDGTYTPRLIPAVTLYFWDEYGDEPLYAYKLKPGEKLATPTPLDKTAERKEFVSWVTTAGVSYRETRAYDSTISFYATYLQKFAVEFYCGDVLKNTLLVEDGGFVLVPPTPDPAESGKAFDGWYTGDGEKWSASLEIRENTVFTAVYKPLHTVTFMLDGQVLDTQSVKDGGIAQLPYDNKYFYTYSPADALYNITESKTVELTAVSRSDYYRENFLATAENGQYWQYMSTNGYVANYATVLYEVDQYFTYTGEIFGEVSGYFRGDRLESGQSVEFDVLVDGVVVNHWVLDHTFMGEGHNVLCNISTPGVHTVTVKVTAMNGIYVYDRWGSNMLCSVFSVYKPR